tara:strand:+ start:85 stop:252 length:168 start_codon:yes stop_codon:yes gene_type:complete
METIKEIVLVISFATGLITLMGIAFSFVLCIILANSGELSAVTIREILNVISNAI